MQASYKIFLKIGKWFIARDLCYGDLFLGKNGRTGTYSVKYRWRKTK